MSHPITTPPTKPVYSNKVAAEIGLEPPEKINMEPSIDHEKSSVMKYIFDIKRDYSGMKFKSDYLERAPSLPSFSPARTSGRDISSLTSGLYAATSQTSIPGYSAPDASGFVPRYEIPGRTEKNRNYESSVKYL